MIRVGIGGWTYEPWRGNFYPAGLAKSRELEYASRHVTAIEINATFRRTMTPASYRRWAGETPDDFAFSLKAPMYVVSRSILAETAEGIARFFDSGPSELGPKLGPILWQFAPSKRFDEADFSAFLELLPREVGGRALMHALEVRHRSFADPRFVALARRFGAAIVYADSDKYPEIADATGGFIYARLLCTSAAEPLGYAPDALDRWAARARSWEEGSEPADLPRMGASAEAGEAAARPVFLFFINGDKERAPTAAQALIERLGAPTG
jgi:uncharacterized protein YecE (DUF72 family)